MTAYSNPRLPEGINNSEKGPLREFLLVTASVLGLLVAALAVLGSGAQWLASQIPFEYEVGVAAPFVDTLIEETAPTDSRIEPYLQDLADRLAFAMGAGPEMPITVHYSPEDTVNAMATLGGHLVIYRGLMERMGSENALAMVIGHEIAHVLHRDPVVSLGRGATVALALGALAGVSSNDIAAQVIGEAGLLSSLSFSRHQEREADSAGLRGLAAVYGHAAGALDLYRIVADDAGAPSTLHLDFFDTHPDSHRRLRTIEADARAQGWALDAAPTLLPDWLPEALALSRRQTVDAESALIRQGPL